MDTKVDKTKHNSNEKVVPKVSKKNEGGQNKWILKLKKQHIMPKKK